MKFLLVFGSTEGQTKKISEFVTQHLTDSNHTVDMLDSRRRMRDIEFPSYDAVILAGSVHQKRHQETLSSFAIAHRSQLEKIPTLFISVSLSIAFSDDDREAQGYVDSFVEFTGLKPATSLLVGGALRFDEYDYFMEQIVEHVVLDNQDPIHEDREFTDWAALERDVDTFAQLAGS